MKPKLIKFKDAEWQKVLEGCALAETYNVSQFIKEAVLEKVERLKVGSVAIPEGESVLILGNINGRR